jgi:hypothetical protein
VAVQQSILTKEDLEILKDALTLLNEWNCTFTVEFSASLEDLERGHCEIREIKRLEDLIKRLENLSG